MNGYIAFGGAGTRSTPTGKKSGLFVTGAERESHSMRPFFMITNGKVMTETPENAKKTNILAQTECPIALVYEYGSQSYEYLTSLIELILGEPDSRNNSVHAAAIDYVTKHTPPHSAISDLLLSPNRSLLPLSEMLPVIGANDTSGRLATERDFYELTPEAMDFQVRAYSLNGYAKLITPMRTIQKVLDAWTEQLVEILTEAKLGNPSVKLVGYADGKLEHKSTKAGTYDVWDLIRAPSTITQVGNPINREYVYYMKGPIPYRTYEMRKYAMLEYMLAYELSKWIPIKSNTQGLNAYLGLAVTLLGEYTGYSSDISITLDPSAASMYDRLLAMIGSEITTFNRWPFQSLKSYEDYMHLMFVLGFVSDKITAQKIPVTLKILSGVPFKVVDHFKDVSKAPFPDIGGQSGLFYIMANNLTVDRLPLPYLVENIGTMITTDEDLANNKDLMKKVNITYEYEQWTGRSFKQIHVKYGEVQSADVLEPMNTDEQWLIWTAETESYLEKVQYPYRYILSWNFPIWQDSQLEKVPEPMRRLLFVLRLYTSDGEMMKDGYMIQTATPIVPGMPYMMPALTARMEVVYIDATGKVIGAPSPQTISHNDPVGNPVIEPTPPNIPETLNMKQITPAQREALADAQRARVDILKEQIGEAGADATRIQRPSEGTPSVKESDKA